MKKNKTLSVVFSVFGAMAIASFCAACGNGEKKYVELDRTALSMDRYERTTLTAQTNDGTVVWSSSDPVVATVDENGVVTSLAGGTTTVTATAGKSKAECTVTVTSTDQTPVIVQSWQTKEIRVGEEITIGYSLTYKTANVTAGAEFGAVVEKPSVVRADGNGKFTALAAGESKITVSASYNGWKGSAIYNVTVAEPLQPFAAPVIAIDGSTVSWTAIEGAASYTLKIGTEEIDETVTGTSVDVSASPYASALEKGVNEIFLKVNATEDYGDSAYSNEVEYTHVVAFAPPVIELNGSTLSWAAIPDATGYTVKIGTDETTVVTVTEIDLKDYATLLSQGNNTVAVKANANAASYNSESAYSAAETYTHTLPFAAPVIEINGSTVSWTAVEGATGYTVKIGTDETTVVTVTEIDLKDYATLLAQGNNTVAVKANANAASYNTESEYSATKTYFHKTPFETPVLTVEGSTASWTAADGAVNYTLQINEASFEEVAATSVNLLEAPYLDAIKPGFDNVITVKANATDERLASAVSESATFDPLPDGAILPTAESESANLTWLPSHEGMNNVFKATVGGRNWSVWALSDIATNYAEKYSDKEYVYFDIWLPSDFNGALVARANCTGEGDVHNGHSGDNVKHTMQCVLNGSFSTHANITPRVVTNKGLLKTGWNTISIKLSEYYTNVGFTKDGTNVDLYFANIRLTESRIPNGVMVPKSENDSVFYLGDYDGKTNVFQAQTRHVDADIINIIENIPTNYAEFQNGTLYFDLWLPEDFPGLTVTTMCLGNNLGAHNHPDATRHTTSAALNSVLTSYGTIPASITTNGGKAVAGWNTVKVQLANQASVGFRKYDDTNPNDYKTVLIGNIRLSEQAE